MFELACIVCNWNARLCEYIKDSVQFYTKNVMNCSGTERNKVERGRTLGAKFPARNTIGEHREPAGENRFASLGAAGRRFRQVSRPSHRRELWGPVAGPGPKGSYSNLSQ